MSCKWIVFVKHISLDFNIPTIGCCQIDLNVVKLKRFSKGVINYYQVNERYSKLNYSTLLTHSTEIVMPLLSRVILIDIAQLFS